MKFILAITLLGILGRTNALKCYDCSLHGKFGELGSCTRTKDCPGLCQTSEVHGRLILYTIFKLAINKKNNTTYAGGDMHLIMLGCAVPNAQWFPPSNWGFQLDAERQQRLWPNQQQPGMLHEQTELDKSHQKLAEQQRYGDRYFGQPVISGSYFQPFPQDKAYSGLYTDQDRYEIDKYPNDGKAHQRDKEQENYGRQFENLQFPDQDFRSNQPFSGKYLGQEFPGQQGSTHQDRNQQFSNQVPPFDPNKIYPSIGTCDTTSVVQNFRNLFSGHKSTSATCIVCHTDFCNYFNGVGSPNERIYQGIFVGMCVIFSVKQIFR